MVHPQSSQDRGQDVVSPGRTQRQKYVGSAGALLPGKFLRIRKVFAQNILWSIISELVWKTTDVFGKFLDCLECF